MSSVLLCLILLLVLQSVDSFFASDGPGRSVLRHYHKSSGLKIKSSVLYAKVGSDDAIGIHKKSKVSAYSKKKGHSHIPMQGPRKKKLKEGIIEVS